MSPRDRERHIRRRRAERTADLKDRLIQTRVPESLESALKDEARKRRLSVSHLIRNVLEDTFHLVDNVVAEVDNLVQDSVGLARQVRRDAERIAQGTREGSPRTDSPRTDSPRAATSETAPARGANAEPAEPARPAASAVPAPAAVEREPSVLDQILAWNKVVPNRDAHCASCGVVLPKGSEAHLGVSQVAGLPPTWLCSSCLARL